MLSGKLISTWSVQCQSSPKLLWYTRWIKWSNGVSEQFSSKSTTPWHTVCSWIIISLNSSRKWTGDTWPNGSWICISSHLGTALTCSITLICIINLKIPFPCFIWLYLHFLLFPFYATEAGNVINHLHWEYLYLSADQMADDTCYLMTVTQYHSTFSFYSMSNPTRKHHIV